MKPAPFRYARPGGTAEVVGLLASQGKGARLLAGGQSLMPLLTRRIERPSLLIDINRIAGLDQIEMLQSHIRMGALVRQEQALRSAIVREETPGVSAALAWVANPVVRSRGTVVGNLVTNSPGAELPAVAIALSAQLVIRYADREETVPAVSMIGMQRRVPTEAMVTHVIWPRRSGRVGFYEVARRDGHAPVVSSMVTLNDDDCSVSLSGVCVSGLSCATAAHVIAQQFPRVPKVHDLASALRADLVGPVYSDAYSNAQYRLDVAPLVIRRATQRMTLQDCTA
jgi:aerobic carbon-monoxide dehydrogenase medium subunit